MPKGKPTTVSLTKPAKNKKESKRYSFKEK